MGATEINGLDQLTPQQREDLLNALQAQQQQQQQAQQQQVGGSNLAVPAAVVAAPIVSKGISAVSDYLSGTAELANTGSNVATAQDWANVLGAPSANNGISGILNSTAFRVGEGALGAYGLYDLLSKPSNRTGTGRDVIQGVGSGAAVGGSILPGVGHVVGGIAGGVGGLIHNMTGSTRGVATKERDAMRDEYQNQKWLDDNYMSKPLSSGATYDWGLDVNNKESLGGEANVPWYIKPEEAEVSGTLDPLGWLMGGGNENLSVTNTGFLTRTAASKGDPMANAKELYTATGYGDYAKDRELFNAMATAGTITNQKRDELINSLDKAFGVNAYAVPQATQHATSSKGGGNRGNTEEKPRPAPPPASVADILPTMSQPPAVTEPDANAHYKKMLAQMTQGIYQPSF